MTGIWIEPANGTRRSYVWLCSACMRRVYARPRCSLKDSKGTKTIDYRLCPYCGTEMTGQITKHEYFDLIRNNHQLADQAKDLQAFIQLIQAQQRWPDWKG